MLYLRPFLWLLLILSVLILSCDPDKPEKKPSTDTTTKDQQDQQDDNPETPEPTKPAIPVASLGAISSQTAANEGGTDARTKADTSGKSLGWVLQGKKITFSTKAKDAKGKEIPNAQFSWEWRKRGKETKSDFGKIWTVITGQTKASVTLDIPEKERVGAYELRVSATNGGQKKSKGGYKFTVRKAGCPAPDTANAPADLAALKAMVTGSSPSVTGEDLKAIDISKVDSLYELFKDDRSFNGEINCWDVSNVTNMEETFYVAIKFNQNIGDWDVSKVTNMGSMFDITIFDNDGNASIGNWDVSKVTNMNKMFSFSSFNQDIGNWDVSSVSHIAGMFRSADKFNHDLSDWVVKQVGRGNCFLFSQGASAWKSAKPPFKVSC